MRASNCGVWHRSWGNKRSVLTLLARAGIPRSSPDRPRPGWALVEQTKDGERSSFVLRLSSKWFGQPPVPVNQFRRYTSGPRRAPEQQREDHTNYQHDPGERTQIVQRRDGRRQPLVPEQKIAGDGQPERAQTTQG